MTKMVEQNSAVGAHTVEFNVRNLKMIFFDIDETLMNHKLALTNAAKKFYKQFGELSSLYNEASFPDIWNEITENVMQLFFQKKISYQEQRRLRLRKIFQKEIVDKEADEMFNYYLKFYKKNWTLFDDVIPCLDYFSDKKLGIISNGDKNQQRKKLRDLDIFDRFKIVTISTDINVHKPHKELFYHACKLANEKVENCFYIGDNFEIDIIGANNAGMKGIWLNRINCKTVDKDIIQINSLNELKNKINLK